MQIQTSKVKQSVFNLNKHINIANNHLQREVLLLGGSGSIGKQAFDLCIANEQKFKIKAIISGKNALETIKQAIKSKPQYIVMSDKESADIVKKALRDSRIETKVLYGADAQKEVISYGYNIAITAIPGIQGVDLTFEAIKYSDLVAFANKETIIYAGELMIEYAKLYNTIIIPIDSEHNAIFQILDGIEQTQFRKIILTASGGPLLNKTLEEIRNASISDILNHPTWKMGKKITVDSATLFNKALEVIEASYLFGVSLDEVDVIIHPQSVVHGIVKMNDGSLLMHASAPDMKLPISYALSWPYQNDFYKDIDLTEIAQLTFIKPDYDKFPMFKLAIDAAKDSIISRIIMNYANEVAVNMFLEQKIKFLQIHQVVEFALTSGLQTRFNLQESLLEDLNPICNAVDVTIKNRFKS
jgi:1-deoxy-D-xylulose-5-phosphate reductoisomerase